MKKKTYKKPYLIEFKKIGDENEGYISVSESKELPFEIKRVFWTYFTPESIVRGRHAHYKSEQILIAVSGKVIVTTELANGEISTFVLDKPNKGIYMPPNVWHTMQYSNSAVQMVLASDTYNESDYIRKYEDFKRIWADKNSR
jgi:dTDP-4-dehydrorhamnose 3,5-epimerase-like enzyme